MRTNSFAEAQRNAAPMPADPRWKRTMKTFITALTLGSLIALPAFLRSANAAPAIDAARARAIHECNVAASTYKQYLWGHFESDTYRACMAEHGQHE